MARTSIKQAKATAAEEELLARKIAAMPERIISAARALNIGPLFAMDLARDGKLPGVSWLAGEWQINMLRLNMAIYDLGVEVANVSKWHGVIDPKWGLNREDAKAPEVEPGEDLGETWTWPAWMASTHYCAACNHDGRLNQLAYKQPCYGWEPSRFMRS